MATKNKDKKPFSKVTDIYREAKKISFPTGEELKRDIFIVIGVCVVCSVFLWGISTGTLAIFRNALGI